VHAEGILITGEIVRAPRLMLLDAFMQPDELLGCRCRVRKGMLRESSLSIMVQGLCFFAL
jgi:hypothetical protein